MALFRRLFLTSIGPDLFGATVLAPVLTGVGVFTFLVGTLFLPSLGPTRVEMILILLLLAAVALLCTAVGQLAVVIERLDRRPDKTCPPVVPKG
jgi:cation transporter-like permease